MHLYDEGVGAFGRTAESMGPEEWGRRACGEWTATELARHVLLVAGWYHEWLDRAEAGDATPPFPLDQLAEHNAAALEELAGLDGPSATVRFVGRAHAYADRVRQECDLPFGYPRGTVTAGLHASVAACEWHLHTWDLAHAVGRGHRPSDPATLFRGAGACLAATQGSVAGMVTSALIPLGARLRPWEALLRRSGRAPGPDD